MCGILGLVRPAQSPVSLSDHTLVAMRDKLAHRGPDGAGLWRSADRSIAIAHRRLAVVDLSNDGAQPFVSPDGRCALVYNGELYNDDEIRRELAAEGVRFRTRSDTETVFAALVKWGVDALPRLRGMYAIGFVDTRAQTLLLARDPLGIKPLYFWKHLAGAGIPEITFASEIPAILAHPESSPRPDLITVSAYLTTIRTTLADRTLFADIRTVRPGEAILFDRTARGGMSRVSAPIRIAPREMTRVNRCDAVLRTRGAVRDSVRRHLRADVPACSLLSGGLDSTIVVREMLDAGSVSSVRTYASGYDDGQPASDPACALRVAKEWGTEHTHAPITRELFTQRWPEMVARLGLPLSTPNEVAINAVAKALRADGQIVALSGEGADELFAGYELPMRQAAAFEAARLARVVVVGRSAKEIGTGAVTVAAPSLSDDLANDPGAFQLWSNAWVNQQLKASVLRPNIWEALEHDGILTHAYASEFEAIRAETPDDADPLESHLRFHRRINLAGLLARLDTATMLEGVEGRTPFADVAIADWAESLPMGFKFVDGQPTDGHAVRPTQTKQVLRDAYRGDLPDAVVSRPKASFPLPFQQWMGDVAPAIRQSDVLKEIFISDAIDLVSRDPASVWQLAWPMTNLALWARRWWG